MKKTIYLGLIMATLALSAQPALAKGGKKVEKMFEKADANGDGVISQSEFLAGAEERFGKMDADGSGDITQEEVKEVMAAKREKMKALREKRDSESSTNE